MKAPNLQEPVSARRPLRARALALPLWIAAIVSLAAGAAWGQAPAKAPPRERVPAAPKPTGDQASAAQARSKAAELLRKIAAEAPGPERYKLVDAVIELGDAAWPVVSAEVPNLMAIVEGEAAVVDLVLGFLPTAYPTAIELAPRLGDEAAWRVVRFALRLAEDDRQTALLTAMVTRSDERIVLAVVPPLVARQHPEVFPRLVVLIDESRPNLAAFAIDVVAAHRHAPALVTLVRLLGIEQRKASAANLPLRIKLIHAISRVGGEAAVPPLMEGLSLPDQRRAIREGLRELGPPAVKAALFLLRTAGGSRLVIALELLSSLRYEAAPQLVSMLTSGDGATRELAVDALAYLGVADVRAEVVRVARESTSGALGPLLRLCLTLYDDDVRKLLFELMEHKDPYVRGLVLDALWRARDPRTFAVLRLVAAQDCDNNVRIQAIRALAGVGDPKGIALLRRMTRAPSHEIKLALVEELAQSDLWQTALPALVPLLGDPDDAVFRATLAALQRLTGHQGPRRGAPWLAWAAAESARPAAAIEGQATRELRFVVDDRELSVVGAGSGLPIVVVSGPPFRDATHLLPWVWNLASDHRVEALRRAPWPYRASHGGGGQWDRELSALLARAGLPRVVLMADAAGAPLAMRYAAGHSKTVARVILMGGPWPTMEAIDRAPTEVLAAVPEASRFDVDWGLAAGWRYPVEVARRVTMRGLLSGLLAVPEVARRGAFDNLADDAFEPILLQRVRDDLADFDPALTPQPVLVVLGDKAPWSASSAAALVDVVKRSKGKVQVARIPGAGALPIAEAPKPTLAAVQSFLGD